MASVSTQLHGKGINHGDLYAHNILVNQAGECLLGDFGAASFYDKNSDLSRNIERVEVRAFGCLVEDVLGLVGKEAMSLENRNRWQKLIADCTSTDVGSRPGFSGILKVLEAF